MCKDSPAETLEHNGLTVEVWPDIEPEDPREWDNMAHMACWHRRYRLGDEQPDEDPHEWFDSLGNDVIHALPLFLYDHSGISISVSNSYPYNDRWDAGQVGWVYVTRDDILRCYGGKRLTKSKRNRALKAMIAEVETYDYYLRGAVWYYVATCPLCGEVKDSCGGFYGYDFDYMLSLVPACDCQQQTGQRGEL